MTEIIAIVTTVALALVILLRKLRELHLSMNSRLDLLLQKTDMLARAEGFRAGQEDHLRNVRRAGAALKELPK